MQIDLGDRIKGYENVFRQHLPNRMPVIIRLDGCHFSSYLKGVKKPFDDSVINAMNETCVYLAKNIPGTVLVYTQSDEISIVINNFKKLNSEPWFNNNIQKMASVSAGMTSAYFSNLSPSIFNGSLKFATFDSRVFVVPKEDVNNSILFRQQDSIRNSVQSLARSLASHKECNNKNITELKNLIIQKGGDWDKLETQFKRGRCIIKIKKSSQLVNKKTGELSTVERNEWIIDNQIPVFSDDTNYINQHFKDIEV